MAATSLEGQIGQIHPRYQPSFLAILKGEEEVSIPSSYYEWKEPFPLQLLVEIVATNPKLRKLKMSSNLRIVSNVESLLVKLIQPSIIVLKLVATMLPSCQLIPLIQALESNSTLQSLELCPIVSSLGTIIGTMVARNRSLLKLKLSCSRLDSTFGINLAPGLKLNSTLVHLDISRNEMGDSAGVAIVDALLSNPSIRELNLSCNEFGPATATELVKLVPRLFYLNLGYNQRPNYGSYGMQAGLAPLLEAIAGVSDLKFLNLRELGLEAPIFAAVGKMLLVNCSLEELILDDSSITDASIRGLAPGIAQNSSLKVLSLKDTDVSAVGSKLLAESLATNQSLTQLNFSLRYDTEIAHSDKLRKAQAEARNAFKTAMEITLTTNTTLLEIDDYKSELMQSILALRQTTD